MRTSQNSGKFRSVTCRRNRLFPRNRAAADLLADLAAVSAPVIAALFIPVLAAVFAVVQRFALLPGPAIRAPAVRFAMFASSIRHPGLVSLFFYQLLFNL